MASRIGDEAPNFTAQTPQGPIKFHDWIGNGWAILFSHPEDFTPVCTTELGYMARLKPEFDQRNTKILGLSIDSVGDHERWANDIKETQGTAANYPIIGDSNLEDVIIPASVSDEDAKRQLPAGWKAQRPYLRIVPQPK